MKKFITSLAVLAMFASAANAEFLLINEVLTNPPGADSILDDGFGDFGNEHFELRGTPGMSLSGYYLLSLEGGGARGAVNQLFDLGAYSIGTNGYLFARQNLSPYTTITPGATVITNASGEGWGPTGSSTVGHSTNNNKVLHRI